MGGFETGEMKDLDDDKDDNASFGDVVDGENNIGGDGCEHGELEEMVVREHAECIDKTEDDAANADDCKGKAFWGSKAKDDVGKQNPEPDGWPRIGAEATPVEGFKFSSH